MNLEKHYMLVRSLVSEGLQETDALRAAKVFAREYGTEQLEKLETKSTPAERRRKQPVEGSHYDKIVKLLEAKGCTLTVSVFERELGAYLGGSRTNVVLNNCRMAGYIVSLERGVYDLP